MYLMSRRQQQLGSWVRPRSGLTGVWKNIPRLLVALSTSLLLSCAPTHNTSNAAHKDANMPDSKVVYVDSKPTLLDAHRQLYKFGDGICRDLSKLPAPWRLVDAKRYQKSGPWGRFPVGYEVTDNPIQYETVVLEADNAAFGIAPANTLPGPITRSGRLQHVVSMIIGPPGWELGAGGNRSIEQALAGDGWPMPAPVPVSPSFRVVTDRQEHASEDSSLAIVNASLNAGVFMDDPGLLKRGWPSPTVQGLIFLGDDEEAEIRLNYEALTKLEEVVRSATEAARVIRVRCPTVGEPR